MSISVGNSMLQESTKVLLLQWDRARQSWEDEKASQFQKDYLDALKPRIKATLLAMDRIADLAAQARRECE